MNVNIKTIYALISLADMALSKTGTMIRASDVANKYGIPPRFLETTLNELKAKGVINSRRGVNGGFFLTKQPSEITLLDIIKVTESSEKIFECSNLPNKNLCVFKEIFNELDKIVGSYLNSITIEDLSKNLETTKITTDFII